MNTIDLNGAWKFRKEGDPDWLPGTVPGCVHTDLLAAGEIIDPYYRDNEIQLQWIGETDWVYARKFDISAEFLDHEKILLHCESLDTLATILINGREVGTADNQFRTWEFDVKDFLQPGENQIGIHFASAFNYGLARLEERYIHSWSTDSHKLPGGNYVRKNQSNFGWDWGPKLVTCGIPGNIQLTGFDAGRLDDVHISQSHADSRVDLSINITVETLSPRPLKAIVSVSYEGAEIASAGVILTEGTGLASISVDDPQLWWPNGLGGQPLYRIDVRLLDGDTVLDSLSKHVGLRTLKLVREDDEWGESFRFECNGVPFFAKGANWIPADTFITRATEADYTRLLQAAKDTHQNMLRVWGGGIYEPDIFYDLCDRMGITVWQDFMFACATYPTYEDDFMSNVEVEAHQQIKRLRHHASLALWCGNNELEQGLVSSKWTSNTMSWDDYGKLFDTMLPDLVAELDPQTDYWPASPHSSKGDREYWNNPENGDAHIWEVWHGLAPFELYRTCSHRFVSEFGFQSFPEPRSIERFTIPSDLSINSPVMEHHQRSDNGNARIIHYMLDWFRLPTDFNHQIMLSQILQAMAMKYAVEHWRRSMPRSMGALYWQLNDCWPVASWASIDYYGRWKALHYMARHFFAPLHTVGIENRDAASVEIYVVNDWQEAAAGEIHWELMTADSGQVILDGHLPVSIAGVTSELVSTLEFMEQAETHGKNNLLLFFELLVDGQTVSDNLVTFCQPKRLNLQDPELRIETEDQRLVISAARPALWVWVDIDAGAPLSDNFFHVLPGHERLIEIPSGLGAQEFAAEIKLYSLWDTYSKKE